MTPPSTRFTAFAVAAGFLAMWPLVEGCTRSTHGSSLRGGAPSLLQEDGPLHARGGTNPNAPYVLASTKPQLVQRANSADAAVTDTCDGSKLAITEIAAAVNGNYRAIKLAFHNHSEAACQLGGYPDISLLDKRGTPVASVTVDRVTMSTLSAQLRQEPAQAASDQSAASVTLAPNGEAWFQLGWSTGEGCPVVSRVSVSAPGSSETFTVTHPLTVCQGRVQITTVHSDQEAN